MNIKKSFFLTLFLLTNTQTSKSANKNSSAITYTFCGGRFGNNLVTYAHAKWISYKFKIPLLYKPFFGSNKLAMHKNELHYNNANLTTYKKKETIYSNFENIKPNAEILYVMPFFHIFYDDTIKDWNEAWNNKGFIAELKKNIRPILQLNLPTLPKNRISVAVHVRRGTGFDDKKKQIKRSLCKPLRMIPDSYYIEQIKNISKLLNDSPLYVCIFTDHTDPNEILNNYKQKINNKNILWDCRKSKDLHSDFTVLSDFFALTTFDCIIRPYSTYSIMASKISNYKIEIYPCSMFKENGDIKFTVKIKDNRLK